MLNGMEKRRKRGEVREDGKVFYRYQASARDGEYWMEPEKFAERVARDAKNSRRFWDHVSSSPELLERIKERRRESHHAAKGRSVRG